MYNENQFWFYFWCIAAAAAVIISVIIALSVQASNKMYYQAYSECIANGGSWIPTYSNNAVCLKR